MPDLAPYHSTMHGRHGPALASPHTRHTRDLAFAGHQMLVHSNAIKMSNKHTKLTHAKPVRGIAIAHTPLVAASRGVHG